MSFIELTLRTSEGITVNTDHIATFRTKTATHTYQGVPTAAGAGQVVTEIQLAGPLPAYAFIQVTESYEEVRRLLGLDWLRCGESFEGDVCDRRLDNDGRCPIHGFVGA